VDSNRERDVAIGFWTGRCCQDSYPYGSKKTPDFEFATFEAGKLLKNKDRGNNEWRMGDGYAIRKGLIAG
jgi:hypothetical protein